jgi:hypothetical protein
MSPCDGLLVPFFQLCEAFSRNPPCVPLAGTENPKNKATAYVRFLRADMYPEGLKPAHESVRRSGKHLLPVLSKVLTAIVVPTIVLSIELSAQAPAPAPIRHVPVARAGRLTHVWSATEPSVWKTSSPGFSHDHCPKEEYGIGPIISTSYQLPRAVSAHSGVEMRYLFPP